MRSENLASAETDRAPDISQTFARCFASRDGQLVLEHLERCFLLRRCPPSASDAELRHLEGQRSAVAHILAMVERGRR